MARIVVIGAGVVALGTAMFLAGDGHQVVVLERDPEGPPSNPLDAWENWERPGLNQFRMAHAFLGGFRAVLDAELRVHLLRSALQIGGWVGAALDRASADPLG
jgi:glycine/D-amino acid oxidase-like deaminating enzyme